MRLFAALIGLALPLAVAAEEMAAVGTPRPTGAAAPGPPEGVAVAPDALWGGPAFHAGVMWHVYMVAAAFVVLVARLSQRLTLPELLAASVPVGTIVAAWIVYLLACFTSAVGTHTIAGGTLLVAYVVYEHFEAFWAAIGPVCAEAVASRNRHTNIVLALVLAIASWVIVPLYNSRMLYPEGGKIFSGGSCWADLPLHLHVAESFLHGRNQDVSWGQLMSPIFAGEPISYPFLPDFHAAVMVKIGSSMRWAFLATGLPLCLSLVTLLFTFAHRLSSSRLGAALTVALVFGTGGMGGWHIAARDGLASALTQDVAQNDTTGESKVVWFAFLPHVVLPQRGANFAYPMALFILTLVWVATEGAASHVLAVAAPRVSHLSSSERSSMLLLAGVCAASLPLVQAHSVVAVGVILGTVFIFDAHKWLADPRLFIGWCTAGVVTLALSYPQLRSFSHQMATGSGGKFLNMGWWYVNHDSGRAGGLGGFFSFWWLNLGPMVPLMILSLTLSVVECASALSFARRAASAVTGGWGALYDEYRKAAPTVLALADAPMYTATAKASVGGFQALSTAPAPARGRSRNRRVAAPGAAAAEGGAAVGEEAAVEDEGEGEHDAAPSAAPAAGVRVAHAYDAAAAAAAGAGATSTSAASSPHFLGHLWLASKASIKADTGIDLDSLLDPARYAWDTPDRCLGWWLNRCSLTARAFDSLKFGVGAFLVFLLGNYVMFQPWDRDNCKLFYVGLFVSFALVARDLAAPLELLLGAAAGSAGAARVIAATGVFSADAFALALWVAQGTASLPARFFSTADRVEMGVASAEGSTGSAGDKDAVTGKPLAGSGGALSKRLTAPRAFAGIGSVATLIALALACLTGYMMLYREFGLYHQLLDEDQQQMGAFIREHVPPKAVILHRDVHILPSGCLAGRPSLVGYAGWMWSHGYNYHDRDRDRNYAMENALKDNDPAAVSAMRRWGVRYVLGEWIPKHHRASQQAYDDAVAKHALDSSVSVPQFDPDMYLDGALKRIHSVGRYDLYEVMGYGHHPQ